MVARAAGKDPLAFRQAMLPAGHARHKALLDLVAQKSGWGTDLGADKARGIAVAESFSSFVAQVAEISRDAKGNIKVDRIVCAVDCGIAINPDVIRAQMEGGGPFFGKSGRRARAPRAMSALMESAGLELAVNFKPPA